MKTPPLPPWIREAAIDGYLTAHVLLPDEQHLYGTEDLFGDWGARLLLLAKDFAPATVLHKRIAEGDPRPYRHLPKMVTNKRLKRLSAPLRARVGDDPTTCGLLYGSALANLLRADARTSGGLPNRREAMAYGARVLSFTLQHMPNLEAIVCMGAEAAKVTAACLGQPGRGKLRDAGSGRVFRDGVRVLAVPHPAARIETAKHEAAWDQVAEALQ